MLQVDKLSRTPIYEQVIAQVEALVGSGAMLEEAVLPSVRALAAELGVNPNTLQKAYAELERRQVCISVPGSGRYVARGAQALLRARAQGSLQQFRALAAELLAAGAAKQELIACIEEAERSENDA